MIHVRFINGSKSKYIKTLNSLTQNKLVIRRVGPSHNILDQLSQNIQYKTTYILLTIYEGGICNFFWMFLLKTNNSDLQELKNPALDVKLHSGTQVDIVFQLEGRHLNGGMVGEKHVKKLYFIYI